MAQLLDIFGFLAVILRALTLAFSAITIGGIIFRWLVMKTAGSNSKSRLLPVAALALAIVQAIYLFANSAMLAGTTGMDLSGLFGASYFIWGCVSTGAALSIFVLAKWFSAASNGVDVFCALLILASTVATSHSASRLDHQVVLLLATAAHQAATAAWIGGLPFFLLTLAAINDAPQAYLIGLRFSRLASWSIAVLLGAGLVLAYFYVGSWDALYGTSYGAMLVAKFILFAIILFFGALNYQIVRQLRTGEQRILMRLRRFSEVEIGIGITAILAAASLTSQPPGVDLVDNRVDLPMIAARLSPRVPRLATPPLSTLTPSQREVWKNQHPSTQAFIPGQSYVPPTPGDIAWSEYNHHWSGLVLLTMGILAVLSRFKRMRWARYWPLAFLGLAAFLFLRADPENWPLGPSGFWESFSSAEVAQHRFFVLLIILFAAFEWGIQTKRLTSQRAALVFPLVCAVGGAMLLTHTHSLTNVKEELLAELSHVPLALLAVAAGWARWLELRLPGQGKEIAGRVWPVCFALIGIVLLLYREA